MKKIGWGMVPLMIFLGLVFFLGKGLFLDPKLLPSTQIGKTLPTFSLADLLEPENTFTQDNLKGQVALLNVWASWCAACNQEQLFLIKLAADGVLMYGLNYQDEPKAAKQWLHSWGNPYRRIASDQDGRLAMDLGVYGAPETFLIDKKGVIRYKHVGILTESIWKKEIAPLKKILETEA